jgi:hypothetical protein
MLHPSLPEERASEIMGAEEGNGLTLEGLALRLVTLERENSELRSKVVTLEGSQMPPGDDEEPARALDGRVSRRRLPVEKAALAGSQGTKGKGVTREIYTFDGTHVIDVAASRS